MIDSLKNLRLDQVLDVLDSQLAVVGNGSDTAVDDIRRSVAYLKDKWGNINAAAFPQNEGDVAGTGYLVTQALDQRRKKLESLNIKV